MLNALTFMSFVSFETDIVGDSNNHDDDDDDDETFFGMVDQRNAFSLISSRNQGQRSSSS